MTKIKVMVEKEIDIEELIKKLEGLDIVDYDEYEGDPIPQHDLHSEVLAVLNNVSKIMYEKDEWYRKSFDLQESLRTSKKQIAEMEEELRKCENASDAVYLFNQLSKRGIKVPKRKNSGYYIDRLMENIDRLLDKMEEGEDTQELQNKINKLQKENEVLRKCVPSCIGGCDNELIDCNMCEYCEQCKELTNA